MAIRKRCKESSTPLTTEIDHQVQSTPVWQPEIIIMDDLEKFYKSSMKQ